MLDDLRDAARKLAAAAPAGGGLQAARGRAAAAAQALRGLREELRRRRQFVGLLRHGPLAGGGGTLHLQYFGRERLAPDFDFLFAAAPAVERLAAPTGLVGFVPLRARLRHAQVAADVRVVDAYADLRPPQGLAYATHLTASLPLPPSVDAFVAQVTDAAWQAALGRALADPAPCRVRTDPAALDAFYAELYAPADRRLLGDTGQTVSLAQMRRWFGRGGRLLLLEEAGRPLAGLLLGGAGGGIASLRPGMAAAPLADPERRQHLQARLQIGLVRHAQASGVARIDMGLTRAQLHNPTLQHKRALGCQFAAVGSRYSLQVAPGQLPRLAQAAPLLVPDEDDGRLWALVGQRGLPDAAALEALARLVRPAANLAGVRLALDRPDPHLAAALAERCGLPVELA